MGTAILCVGRKPQLMEQFMVTPGTIHQCALAGMAYNTLRQLTYGLQSKFLMMLHYFEAADLDFNKL